MPIDSLMNEPAAVFLIIMSVLLITPLLSASIHLPGIIGLILGGMIIGPYGLDLLQSSGPVELLAMIGLIYLMFGAGLEVDLHRFARIRKKAFLFGILTFIVPLMMGLLFGLWLGMSPLGALLLGSAFSSHTLIAMPILTRLGIVRNESVAVTIGATILSTVLAFIVLAVVLNTKGGTLSIGYFAQLIGLLAVYTAFILVGIPKLGKMFFRKVSSTTIEFQFVLVVLFLAAFLAELIGINAIVGAFLAGLAINATIPHSSAVIGRVLFLGESFFIPMFLMYTGMITDPKAFFLNSETLLIGLGITVIAYISKLIAAWITARIYHYSRNEMLTIWGLSQAQAAVTIPTLLLGLQFGFFSQTVFNGAILMIVLTSISSPLLVQHFGSKVEPDHVEENHTAAFDRVLVPIANPKTQEHLITLASLLARSRQGVVLPCHILREVDGKIANPDLHQQLMEAPILSDPDTQIERVRRIDSSISKGILNAAIERDATAIVMGWQGDMGIRQTIFGSVVDEVVWKAKVPVLIGKIETSVNAVQKIVMIVPADNVSLVAARHALKIVVEIAQTLNVPFLILSASPFLKTLEETYQALKLDHPHQIVDMKGGVISNARQMAGPNDLLVIPTIGSSRRYRSSLGRIPQALSTARMGPLVVIHYMP